MKCNLIKELANQYYIGVRIDDELLLSKPKHNHFIFFS